MDAVEYWLNELSGKADSTKKRYLSFFIRFSDWLDETPDEILENRNARARALFLVSLR